MATYTPVQLSISTKSHGADAAPGLGLTPPVTPTIDDRAGSPSTTLPPVADVCCGNKAVAVSSPPQFFDQLEYQLDEEGRRITFGNGAWSVVYKAFASSCTSNPTRPFTPPSSPNPAGRLVAVKSPGRRDARPVMYAEALALTRASSTPGSEHYIVPFHGYIADSSSIVMSAVPLALSSYIEDKARIAQQNFSIQTMHEPVLGMAQWHDLAKKLIKGLSWLHSNAQIVHGDIKPHNILLRPRISLDNDINSAEFPYEPLFADFSSSYSITASGTEIPPNACLSAVTTPFTAPELLKALRSPDVIPEPASDVFSLAVTLLGAATGDILVYSGLHPTLRIQCAKDGHLIIDWARQCGTNGTRLPPNGLVEKIVKPAVAKVPAERITAHAWMDIAGTV
ncbi:kinase-like domain-containing protein [Aspergillus falconensis]